jgi:hypothetical protein
MYAASNNTVHLDGSSASEHGSRPLLKPDCGLVWSLVRVLYLVDSIRFGVLSNWCCIRHDRQTSACMLSGDGAPENVPGVGNLGRH